ncbi:hypothetical protein JTE90_010871 [Oedothorax gibbosus]|nr:hypothetical protein JTE90_010871 [Oedothorax gibbosus]
MSLKCLDENMYVRDKCEEYFENYRNCKHFWNYVSRDRMSKGIWPKVPLPEDREAVKKEYLKKITIKK